MTIGFNYQGGMQPLDCQRLSNSAVTRIGDAVGNDATTLAGFSFANDSASTRSCTLYWFDGAAENLIWRKSVAAGDTALVSEMPIKLRRGHEIRVKGDADVWVSLLFSFSPPNSVVEGNRVSIR